MAPILPSIERAEPSSMRRVVMNPHRSARVDSGRWTGLKPGLTASERRYRVSGLRVSGVRVSLARAARVTA